MPKQTLLVYYFKMKFKPQATGQKREINNFNWMTLNTIPQVSNIWATSNLTPFSKFIICKNTKNYYTKNISPYFPSVKIKKAKKEIKQKTLSFIKLNQTFLNNCNFKKFKLTLKVIMIKTFTYG